MTSAKHQITAHGIDGSRVSLGALRDMTSWLADGVDRAMRLRAEGRSSAPGARPRWLVGSDDVKVTGLHQGSMILNMESTPLRELLSVEQAQTSFWPDAPVGDETPLDLLLDSLDDALAKRADSERLDAGMLDILSEGKSLFARHGIQRLSMQSGWRSGKTLEITDADFEMIRELRSATPPPDYSKVTGRLDGLWVSARAFAIEIPDGVKLRGVLPPGVDVSELGKLLDSSVVAEGQVLFKPSGNPLRLDATHIAAATEADLRWQRVPSSKPRGSRPRPSPVDGPRMEDFEGAFAG